MTNAGTRSGGLQTADLGEHTPRSQTLFGNAMSRQLCCRRLRNRVSKTSAFPNRVWERGRGIKRADRDVERAPDSVIRSGAGGPKVSPIVLVDSISKFDSPRNSRRRDKGGRGGGTRRPRGRVGAEARGKAKCGPRHKA